jgi:Fic family protein
MVYLSILLYLSIMNPDSFSERSGEIILYKSDNDETIATFEPVRLPPEIEYDQDMVRLVEEAASNLNDLKGTGRNLSNPNIFIQPYLLKEAVLSSQIEGTQTSFEEAVMQAGTDEELENKEMRDIQEVINYKEALEYGRERIQYEPLSVDLIKRIHDRLMSGVRGRSRSPGEFRTKQVHIGEVGVDREDAEFVPMQPSNIESFMEDLVNFMNADYSMPYLLKSALIHYQFETIHPFEDGNGRMGRLLIILDMLDKEKLAQPLLYLSEYFNNNKSRYYDRLQKVREEGDFENWIKFYLRAVKTQSQSSTDTAIRILNKQSDYKEKLREENVPENCMILMENMLDLETRTITKIANELGVGYHAARGYVRRLQNVGIIREIDSNSREKKYVAGELLDLMEEESERILER